MIAMENVSKRWEERDVLKCMHLTIAKGECVAVLGENGAGKSTLLKLIAMLITPTSGVIYVDGQPITEVGARIRQKIGYVFHQHSFYPHLTAIENLKIVCKWYRVADVKNKILEVLSKVGLYFSREDKVQHFSRGMLQRLAIARALLINAPLLLLDEPHTGLDQDGIEWLNTMIDEFVQQGVTILLVSHDLGQVQKLASRVIWMKNGQLIRDIQRSDVSKEIYQELISSWGDYET